MVYFVGTHTRSTVPRGRSAAALGADATVAQILIMLYMIRVGKGLTLSGRVGPALGALPGAWGLCVMMGGCRGFCQILGKRR